MTKAQELIAELNKKKIDFELNEPLASYTTWKIGGPADILVKVTQKEILLDLIKLSHKINIPLTVLGAGSNILISDEGIRGLVIINKVEYITVGEEDLTLVASSVADKIQARLDQLDTENYYSFEDIDYDESSYPAVFVTVSSGFYLPKLINVTINKGVTGLQWFAGIPGTIGGAVYNNIHGGTYFLSDFIETVTVLDREGNIKELSKDTLKFDYDHSYFHTHKSDVILEVKLKLFKGDTQKALAAAINWAQKKRLQPYNSAGCCFKNVTATEMERLKLLSSGWGYIIDKVLSLKGIKAGDAMISTRHAAFIENLGHATAADVLSLFDLIYESAEQKLGIRPTLEIFMLGFPEEISKKYQ